MENNQLSVIVKESGLQPAQAKPLLDNFGDYFVKAHKLAAKAKGIKVTDVSQVDEMQAARDLRLELKSLRVEANKTRTTLKEGYLRGGNAVQEIFNNIRDVIKPMEEYLDEQEKFAQRVKEAEEAKVEQERINKLSQYVEDVSVFKLHPSELSTESFEKLLGSSKSAHEAKVEAERQAEEERIAKEKAEKEEQERIRKENEKLRKEAEEREKAEAERRKVEQEKLDKERKAREKAESKLKAEKEAKEKAERERLAKEEAERKAKEEEKRKALLAPDVDKLFDLQKEISNIELPALKTDEAQEYLNGVKNHLQSAIMLLRKGIDTL